MSHTGKGTKEDTYRPGSKPRKRRSNFKSAEEIEQNKRSASEKKIDDLSKENIVVDKDHGYCIISLSVFSAISNIVICAQCKENPVTFKQSEPHGLGFKIIANCKKCGSTEINSGPKINSGFDVNRRLVFVMRLLGIGLSGIELFCGLMEFGKGLSKSAYLGIVTHINDASRVVWIINQRKAVKEEKEENVIREKPEKIIEVSGDGSWKKRGFSSKYGVITLIGYSSGKVIDFEVKTTYCHSCAQNKDKLNDLEWVRNHAEVCEANHEGSAGGMETAAIVEMFTIF